MNPVDSGAIMLLAVNGLALLVGGAIAGCIVISHRRARAMMESPRYFHPAPSIFPQRPAAWFAVRSRDRKTVQSALQEINPKLRSWLIAPPVNGWTIVAGPALPNPSDDVDECFHFLTALSRKLGHVQFFYTEKILHHHAWARMDEGCVTRAYAWAGETVWNQGCKTVLEIQLRMKCFHYGESAGAWETAELTAANVEKIPLLAAHWSIDPSKVNELLAAREPETDEPFQSF